MSHLENQMLIRHPLYSRRICFLNKRRSDPTRLTDFFQELKEDAEEAIIGTMSQDSMVLHKLVENMPNTSQWKDIKTDIIDLLSQETGQFDMRSIMERISKLEPTTSAPNNISEVE